MLATVYRNVAAGIGSIYGRTHTGETMKIEYKVACVDFSFVVLGGSFWGIVLSDYIPAIVAGLLGGAISALCWTVFRDDLRSAVAQDVQDAKGE